MGEMLKKERAIFVRGSDGKLLPQEIVLELLHDKPSIKYIPMDRGKLLEINSNSSNPEYMSGVDDMVVLEHCMDPKFTKDELRDMKKIVKDAIVIAIMSASLDKPQEAFKKELKEKESTTSEGLPNTLDNQAFPKASDLKVSGV